MNEILVAARLKIKPGKMDDFKKTGYACVEMVQQKDKGTLQYDWFYNEEISEFIVLERYIDSDAALEHIANTSGLVGGLLALSEISLEVYGNPSQKLINTLEGFEVVYYKFDIGLGVE